VFYHNYVIQPYVRCRGERNGLAWPWIGKSGMLLLHGNKLLGTFPVITTPILLSVQRGMT
jgi:hypothetical protein